MDINQGCAGYIIGLFQSFMLLDQESISKVVLLNADALSSKVSNKDRNSNPLIGDAAAITIIEKSIEFSGIQKRGLSWLVQIRNKNEKRISKSFKNLQYAITFRDEYLKKIEEQRIKDIYSLPITYTHEGIAYIELTYKDDTVKCLVDEDNWYFCKTKSLYFDSNYVRITINGKDLQFNRYIYEEFVGPITEDVIDHINQNKLDNRLQNLEDTTHSVNNYNRTFKKVSSGGYKGVVHQDQ